VIPFAVLTPLQAALLGLVEGLTEYLPVSSTGHLILASYWMGHASDPAVKSFEIVIQSGAILAVLGLYRQRVAQMVRGLLGRDPAGRALVAHLVAGFLPAGVLGFLLHETIKGYLFGPYPVAFALAAGGLGMIVLDGLRHRRAHDGSELEGLTWRRALLVGLAQCLAMWPGTSRSLTTILAGLGVGLKPRAAAEFSFLLALPTLGGATVLDLVKEGDVLWSSLGPTPLVIGMIVAFVSAALAVKGFVAWLGSHGLIPFGVYRIVLAGAVFLVLI
jgi:undecaprenyl-diphosphatase